MPLAFFNHCWKAHRYTKILDYCGLVSYHATCEMVARSKRAAMNSSLAYVQRLECPLSMSDALTHQQLKAYKKRKVPPARLTMQERP